MKKKLVLCLLSLTLPCAAQDIEPRRWSHLPLDTFTLGCSLMW